MADYTVAFTTAAARDLAELPRDVLRRVDARIDALARDPRPGGVEKLAGGDGLYRVRVGDYRIIYEIADRLLVVTITRVRHRRDVYRRRYPGAAGRSGATSATIFARRRTCAHSRAGPVNEVDVLLELPS